jgi:hypothetical protein
VNPASAVLMLRNSLPFAEHMAFGLKNSSDNSEVEMQWAARMARVDAAYRRYPASRISWCRAKGMQRADQHGVLDSLLSCRH